MQRYILKRNIPNWNIYLYPKIKNRTLDINQKRLKPPVFFLWNRLQKAHLFVNFAVNLSKIPMVNEIPDFPLPNGSSATHPPNKRYSAKELTEVLKTSPEVFMMLDLKVQTNAWNLDYIFDFLYYIRDVKQIDFMIVWFTSQWTKDKGVHSSFTNASNKNRIL